MFEKSKITWHLTNFEVIAGTSTPCREAIVQMAARAGLMDKSVEFTKDTKEPELGAAYLVMALSEMASETKAPPELLGALSDLLSEAVATIQSHARTNPGSVAIPLLPSAMAIQVKLLSAVEGSDVPPANSGQVTG